jgi:UDP-glucuronate decarboxylase
MSTATSTGAVNLGNPIEVTILELARLIISLVGSRSRIELRALPEDDPHQRCPDITRAKQLLHWSPKVQLEDGLKRTIAYFDAVLSSPSELKKLIWRAT